MTNSRRTLLIVMASALGILFSGCATTTKEAPPGQVKLTDEGRIYVGSTYTGLANMTPRLKQFGCNRFSKITISIPHNTSPTAIERITQALHKGGFRRLLFVKPRRTVTEVGEDPIIQRINRKRGR